MTGRPDREERYRRLIRQQKLGMLFARPLLKRRRGLIDRLLVALAGRLARRKAQPDDFMRDPIIDAEPEFSVAELKRFSGDDRGR